jgi:hypothetical protein
MLPTGVKAGLDRCGFGHLLIANCATGRVAGAKRRQRSVRGPCFSAEGGAGASQIRANPDCPLGRAPAASSAAQDCCIRRTLQKSAGPGPPRRRGGATAAGARSGEAVASAAATSCLFSLNTAALSKRPSPRLRDRARRSTVSASDAALLLPPERNRHQHRDRQALFHEGSRPQPTGPDECKGDIPIVQI